MIFPVFRLALFAAILGRFALATQKTGFFHAALDFAVSVNIALWVYLKGALIIGVDLNSTNGGFTFCRIL